MTLVIVNNFDAGPHADSELVLLVRDRRWEMEVQYRHGTYHVYALRLNDEGKHHDTRLAADGGATPRRQGSERETGGRMIQAEQ